MKQELEYTVILKDGIKYDIEQRDANNIALFSHYNTNNSILEIWINHRRILINVDMIIAVERKEVKNFDKRTKWQKLIDKFKKK